MLCQASISRFSNLFSSSNLIFPIYDNLNFLLERVSEISKNLSIYCFGENSGLLDPTSWHIVLFVQNVYVYLFIFTLNSPTPKENGFLLSEVRLSKKLNLSKDCSSQGLNSNISNHLIFIEIY